MTRNCKLSEKESKDSTWTKSYGTVGFHLQTNLLCLFSLPMGFNDDGSTEWYWQMESIVLLFKKRLNEENEEFYFSYCLLTGSSHDLVEVTWIRIHGHVFWWSAEPNLQQFYLDKWFCVPNRLKMLNILVNVFGYQQFSINCLIIIYNWKSNIVFQII